VGSKSPAETKWTWIGIFTDTAHGMLVNYFNTKQLSLQSCYNTISNAVININVCLWATGHNSDISRWNQRRWFPIWERYFNVRHTSPNVCHFSSPFDTTVRSPTLSVVNSYVTVHSDVAINADRSVVFRSTWHSVQRWVGTSGCSLPTNLVWIMNGVA